MLRRGVPVVQRGSSEAEANSRERFHTTIGETAGQVPVEI